MRWGWLETGRQESKKVPEVSVEIVFAAVMREFTGDVSSAKVSARNVAEMLERLNEVFPGIKDRLLDETGSIRHYINIFVDGVNARTYLGIKTPLREGSEVYIVPSVAGG